ncbi:AtzE family amidohydrolase [Salinarimonas ramus]|uniref:Amidase n=1 Tax=Salinarimonas ramus TaxID=690164 RepID=A0A917Q6L6_9HYPH|nr:AtzE family amidohydrolase [Salinarimonas ramus]GGK30392.1 amidase [Salinarimonas ramus]
MIAKVSSATSIAARVRSGETRARDVVEAALATIAATRSLGAFTDVTAERARAKAAALDEAVAAGADPGLLAGVPFAVKNLFDVEGLATRAGSKINRDVSPALADATLVARLEAAGAVLVGALNMGEYAYDFTGENVHDGASRNPHDPAHMSGGSSGGSGTAVAAGLVPLALGSDTNGSIRVPSALCGTFGLKPTYGRLPRSGTFPFVASLDHLGPMARSVADLALAYDAMQGFDAGDPACARRPVEPTLPALPRGVDGLRVGVLGGYFASGGRPEAYAAVARAAEALGARESVEIADIEAARAAAYVVTMQEGAALHLERLRTRGPDFDPAVRTRLIAGAMLPGAWGVRAHKLRRLMAERFVRVFQRYDALLAPATPCRAPRIGQETMVLEGVEMPVRPNLGLYTQPISFVGLPVVAAPLFEEGERLPLGVQIIAPPWREDVALRLAAALEQAGVATAPVGEGTS